MTPTAIGQYRRAIKADGTPHSELFILESGDAYVFEYVKTTGKRAGQILISLKPPLYEAQRARFPMKLSTWYENGKRKGCTGLAGGAIVNGCTRYYGDTRPSGNDAVLVELSPDAKTLTLYFFANMAGQMARLYNEWCTGRLVLQQAAA